MRDADPHSVVYAAHPAIVIGAVKDLAEDVAEIFVPDYRRQPLVIETTPYGPPESGTERNSGFGQQMRQFARTNNPIQIAAQRLRLPEPAWLRNMAS